MIPENEVRQLNALRGSLLRFCYDQARSTETFVDTTLFPLILEVIGEIGLIGEKELKETLEELKGLIFFLRKKARDTEYMRGIAYSSIANDLYAIWDSADRLFTGRKLEPLEKGD